MSTTGTRISLIISGCLAVVANGHALIQTSNISAAAMRANAD